jgi:SAM-dependent methyltransferase
VPDYWWYRARARLLRETFDAFVDPATGARRVLDVGSADGPANFWEGRSADVIAVDPDRRGLVDGGICARLPELPFEDGLFDVVTAFDVIEHCAPEAAALDEVFRVLRPGGLFLMSVPAYQWAWTDFDVANGHHRRYTRRRAVTAVERSGFVVRRATYAFCAVFPAFAAQRLGARLAESRRSERTRGPVDVVPVVPVSPLLERAFLRLCQLDERVLSRHDLPFGSSVLVAAARPPASGSDSSAATDEGAASSPGESSSSESRATM